MATLRSQTPVEILASFPESEPTPVQSAQRSKASASKTVIVLTDSDSDDDAPLLMRRAGAKRPSNSSAGPDEQNELEGHHRIFSPARRTADSQPVYSDVDLVPTPPPLPDELLLETERLLSPKSRPSPRTRRKAGNVIEQILHALFEDQKHPKVDRGKGKRKQRDAETDAGTATKKLKVDYADVDRPFKGGKHYAELSLEHLQTDFPFIPKTHLRLVLSRNKGLYAPTHIYIVAREEARQRQRDANEQVDLPYNRRATPYRPKGKGTAKSDDELDAERNWLAAHLADKASAASTHHGASGLIDVDDEEGKDGIECGCCFSTCRIGMDQSGCSALIPYSELNRFLPEKLMSLWERVKQRKDLEAAGLEDLEECPFCEWACVNPDEKLLRCGNSGGMRCCELSGVQEAGKCEFFRA
ncbi:hypothetical protein DXG03_004216 [Asterophora parasitica]|uniref:Uncharacterized protein n=1 Tax=Asterophora parasitica TaxID=117018 RepID=A0A9P7G9V5_9AGAR|nr:hypothetical protein DXG03_004216 [Asterophora parasitica]